MRRALNDLHRGIVHEHIFQFDIGILRGELAADLAPQPGGGNHIGFIHQRQFFAASPGQPESQVQDTLDLLARIDTGIVRRIAVFAASLRTAEIHAAGQLTHANEIGPLDNFGLERRTPGQRIEHRQRTKVRKKSERLAHTEQSLFGTHLRRRIVIVFGIADGTEQDHIRRFAHGVRFGRIRVARRVDRTSADQRLAVFELMAVLSSDAVEHLHRLAHDLGADAVSRQKSNLQFHLLNDFK